MTNPVIDNIRRSLWRTDRTPLDPRPVIYESRLPESLDSECAKFLEEVGKLSGVAQKLSPASVDASLQILVREQNIHRATAWETPYLRQLGITEILNSLGVELVSPNADKHEMALCDLGITEAYYLHRETGTGFENDNTTVFFAEVDGNLAGRSKMMKWWNQFGYVEDIVVNPEYRGLGMGRKLLERGIQWARENRFPGGMLETQDNNVLACTLYQSCGFVLGGFDRNVYKAINPNTKETAVYWYLIF